MGQGSLIFIVGGVLMLNVAAASCAPPQRDFGAGGAGGASSMSSASASSASASSASASSASASSASASSSSSSSGGGGMGGGAICMPGEGTVLAATHFYYGEGNNGEWKKFGFNIDGKVSTAASVDLCTPNAGGMASTAYPDGDNGIDNSFGKNILPTLLAIDPTFVMDINASIAGGNFTMLLKMECLPPMGDISPLTTKLFSGTSLGMPPKFDGTDKWPVAPEFLGNPNDADSSTVVFGKSSVIGTLFDSGTNQTVILTLPFGNTSVVLTLHAAHVTMNLAADRKSATGGMIGGVLNTEEYVAELNKIGYQQNLCGTPLWMNFLNSIRQASDILGDGSQDPTKTCDGISIGLGFDLKEVQIGGVGPMTPMAMACP